MELDENKIDLEDGLFDRNMSGFNRFPRYISRRKSCCNSRTRGRFKQRFLIQVSCSDKQSLLVLNANHNVESV